MTMITPVKKVLALAALGILAFMPAGAAAQAAGPDADGPLGAGATDCFEYYRFGSVQANLRTDVVSTVSGVPITFSGTLSNENPYPLVEGALYAKVFKVRGESDGNGPDVVDEFLVKDGIAIPAQGSIPISFSWEVPSYARSGGYELATFFTTSHKFNLLGLTFTDDVVGNTVPFSVSGESSSGVAFDKTSVAVEGKPYFFAAFPPSIAGKDPVTITAAVRNTTDRETQIAVAWTVYRWDAQLPENVVSRKTSTVTVPAHGTAAVTIDVADARYPMYLVRGSLSWKDAKSVIGVRFARRGVNLPRINFPSLTSFPLKKGERVELFSCLHNAGVADMIEGGKLELTLTDPRGRTVRSYTYKGGVTGEMMGVADPFVPDRDYEALTLDAKLTYKGELVDSVRIAYDCEQIDPMGCTKRETLFGALRFLSSGSLLWALLAFAALGALALAHRMRRGAQEHVEQAADRQLPDDSAGPSGSTLA